MFCANCGSDLGNSTPAFCPNCGARMDPPRDSNSYDQQAPYQQPNPYDQQPSYQQPNPFDQQPNPYNQQPNPYNQPNPYDSMNLMQPALPMRWYKFVIYVQLFLSALVSVINGIAYFSGSFVETLTGGGSPELVFAFYPALQPLCYFLGIVSIGSAVFAIITRQWLAHYLLKGITALYAVYALSIASNLICMVGLMMIFEVSIGDLGSTYIGSIIGLVILLALSRVYFNKRRHLFH